MSTDRRLIIALQVRLARLEKLLAEANRIRTLLSDRNIYLLNKVHELEKANRRVFACHIELLDRESATQAKYEAVCFERDTAQRDLEFNEIRIRSRVKDITKLQKLNEIMGKRARAKQDVINKLRQYNSRLSSDNRKLRGENEALAAVACPHDVAIGDAHGRVVCGWDFGKPGDAGIVFGWQEPAIIHKAWERLYIPGSHSEPKDCCLCPKCGRYTGSPPSRQIVFTCPNCIKEGRKLSL